MIAIFTIKRNANGMSSNSIHPLAFRVLTALLYQPVVSESK